jgi:hypothetical protein
MSTDLASAPSHYQTEPSHIWPSTEFTGGRPLRLWRDETGPSFADLLDALNPLQHIPVVSSIYRAVTGDEIGHAARVLGDALFGGPVGMLMAGINALVKEATGGEPGDHLVALVRNIVDPDEPPAAVAGDGRTAASPHAAAAEGAADRGPEPAGHFQARSPGHFRAATASSSTIRADDVERRRIADSILEAQRAQSHLLLSSLGLAPPGTAPADGPAEAGAAPAPAASPPPSVSPGWLAHAMERGLRQYEAARLGAASPTAVDERR